MARWNSCNVLLYGADSRRLWQFEGGSLKLKSEQTSRNGEPLPSNLVSKNWITLFQPKLNVAWLPPESVFIRVAQFPQSTPEETRSMVELQLEKLSPIPVTQAVWSMNLLPNQSGNMQTIIVTIVARSVVEGFLGKLEEQRYHADRLELPMLDQLQAATIKEDGAWIYPESQGSGNTALVAWWYGGILHSVDLLTLPAGENRAAGLKDQLTQMAWAGELDGWLTSPPRWHLVADEPLAETWLPLLNQGLELSVEAITPLPKADLAARTARRVTGSELANGLMPPEYAERYKQRLVDRLWMRGLGAVVGLYLIGLLVYFAALFMLNFQVSKVVTEEVGQRSAYTNSLQLSAQLKVLNDRHELKYAALDCYEAVAETLPASITLDSMNFGDGKTLSLSGTAPADQVIAVSDFCDKLRKSPDQFGKPLFNDNADPPSTHVMPGGIVRWSYNLELKRTEI